MLLAALSLFFVHSAPLDMPRGESYLLREAGVSRLVDLYDVQDLWVSQAVVGRWFDDDGRMFMLSELVWSPPALGKDLRTRADYADGRRPMKRVRANRDFPKEFLAAVSLLAPCPVMERPRPPRQLPHGYKDVCYWQNPTNYADIVCTFRPEKSEVWYLASWTLAEGDDYPTQMGLFEDRFLRKEFSSLMSRLPSRVSGLPPSSRNRKPEDGSRKMKDARRERELLRDDVRHAVAAYPEWHFSGAEEFAVVDDLPSRDFTVTLTNDFPVMRAKYAAAVPTLLDGSNVLSVVRIYADRAEYLDALAADDLTNLAWTAAYWSPMRKELVAHLPARGEKELLRTIRHEAFHQYLSYATSMIAASPWLNEGYAQYFEDEDDEAWGPGVDLTDEGLDRLSALIPTVLKMDYGQFYSGTDFERYLKYRLAWSVVRFLEKGADQVRLKPFAGLKHRYLDTLLETRDMRAATAAAFRDADLLRRFVSEWRKFWKKKK